MIFNTRAPLINSEANKGISNIIWFIILVVRELLSAFFAEGVCRLTDVWNIVFLTAMRMFRTAQWTQTQWIKEQLIVTSYAANWPESERPFSRSCMCAVEKEREIWIRKGFVYLLVAIFACRCKLSRAHCMRSFFHSLDSVGSFYLFFYVCSRNELFFCFFFVWLFILCGGKQS